MAAEQNELFMIHALHEKPLFSVKLTLRRAKTAVAQGPRSAAMKSKTWGVYLGRLRCLWQLVRPDF